MSDGPRERSPDPLLEIEDLVLTVPTDRGSVTLLDGVRLSVAPGECLGLVGESGSGKSLTARAVLGLLPEPGGRIETGAIRLRGEDLVAGGPKAFARHRGRTATMIFQDALTALNPYLRISEQLTEGVMHHEGISRKEALARAVGLLNRVGIPAAARRIHDHPHRFSGGMLQRVMIAMALMPAPELILADEPTSALDVTLAAQTLRLLDESRASAGAAVMLITHDLGVVAGRSDRIAVMYAGRIVETGPTAEVLARPAHPYLEALLRANPSLERETGGRLTEIPGQPPRPDDRPRGCAFAPRCMKAMKRCGHERPPCFVLSGRADVTKDADRHAACWLVNGNS